MDSLEWTCRALWTVVFWIWFWAFGTVAGQRQAAKHWLHDAVTSRPEGVTLRFTPTFTTWCAKKGIEPPEPLELTPYQLTRKHPLSRQRVWIVFVPNGAMAVIAAGTIEVHVDHLPQRTTLRVEEVGEIRPRKPRGGLKIPTMPHFSPAWATPGFA